MKRVLTATAARKFVEARDDIELLRFMYCYQVGSTFVQLSLMENAVVQAMSMCDRVKVANTLGADAPAWRRLIEKTSTLQSSTLGNLIAILSRHDVSAADLSYLKWVKARRDLFVHRLFQDGAWPGELEGDDIAPHYRRLLYLERIFERASRRIWRVFARART